MGDEMSQDNMPVSLELQKIKEAAQETATQAYVGNGLNTSQYEECVSNIEHANSIDEVLLELAKHNLVVQKAYQGNTREGKESIKCHGARKIVNDSILFAGSIDIDVAHSFITMDYMNIRNGVGLQELKINAVHSTIKILVPDNYEIENRVNEVYSSISDKRKLEDGAVTNKIRISGDLVHSSIKVVRPRKRLISLIINRFI